MNVHTCLNLVTGLADLCHYSQHWLLQASCTAIPHWLQPRQWTVDYTFTFHFTRPWCQPFASTPLLQKPCFNGAGSIPLEYMLLKRNPVVRACHLTSIKPPATKHSVWWATGRTVSNWSTQIALQGSCQGHHFEVVLTNCSISFTSWESLASDWEISAPSCQYSSTPSVVQSHRHLRGQMNGNENFL